MIRKEMGIFTWITLGLLTLGGLAACGAIKPATNSDSDDKGSRESDFNEHGDGKGSREFGFNELGDATTCNSLPDGHACLAIATPFSDACLNAGFQIKYCEGCALLCSEKAVVPFGTKKCSYFGKSFAAGQTFPSADGCNTCSCRGESGTASCTEDGCSNIHPFVGVISRTRVDETTDELVTTLEYQSCNVAPFNLRIDVDSCGKASPWQCDAFIFYKQPRTDCAEQKKHEVRFPLVDLSKRPAALYIRGVTGSCERVIIDDGFDYAPNLCE